MRQFLERNYVSTFILSVVTISTLGVLFLVRPALERFDNARREARTSEAEYQAISERLARARAHASEAGQLTPEDQTKLRGLFVESPETATLLTLLHEHSTASRFLLTSLEVNGQPTRNASPGPAGPLEEVHVQAQVKGGGYRELKELFKLLTISTPLTEISSFTFDQKSASASLNLKAYQIAPSAEVGTPVDLTVITDPRFRALRAPLSAPSVTPAARANPFAPWE